MMSVLLYLIVITCILIQVSSKEVKWKVRDTSPKLGQNLILFCEVHNCTLDEIKRWYGGPENKPLMSNSGISTDKANYHTAIEKNGFILTILNLTVKDLNVSYTCSCGFGIDEHILYIEDVYTVDNLNKSTNGTNYVGTNDGSEIYVYVKIALPITVVIFILLFVVLIVVMKKRVSLKRLIEKFGGSRITKSDEDEDSKKDTESLLVHANVESNLRQRLDEGHNTSPSSVDTYYSDEVDSRNVTDPLLEATHVDSNLRQSSDEDNIRNVGDLLLPTVCTEDSYGSSGATFDTAEESLEPSTSQEAIISQLAEAGFFYSDEDNIRNVGDLLLPTVCTEDSYGSSGATFDTAEESLEPSTSQEAIISQLAEAGFFYSDEDNIRNVGDLLLPTVCTEDSYGSSGATFDTAEESLEPSTSREATISQLAEAGFFYSDEDNIRNVGDLLSPTVCTGDSNASSVTTFYSAEESLEPSASREATIVHLAEAGYFYLAEESLEPSTSREATISQLAEAGFFYSGHNIAICFCCGNKIYLNKGLDPFDEAFHHNCAYIRQKKK